MTNNAQTSHQKAVSTKQELPSCWKHLLKQSKRVCMGRLFQVDALNFGAGRRSFSALHGRIFRTACLLPRKGARIACRDAGMMPSDVSTRLSSTQSNDDDSDDNVNYTDVVDRGLTGGGDADIQAM